MEDKTIKIGDTIRFAEIMPGMGISGGYEGEVVDIIPSEEEFYYIVNYQDRYRLVAHQDRWGYAYNFFDRYEKQENGKWKRFDLYDVELLQANKEI